MIGIEKLILSSIGGSIITIFINGCIKRFEKRENLKKQKKIFIQFIDNIIIKYLEKHVVEYNQILEEINGENLFESRVMSVSPMLNKNIFDFFEKSDLIKIFSYCKKNSLVEVYHNFYEIEFLKANTPLIVLDVYLKKLDDHFGAHKIKNETFKDHIKWCAYYKQQSDDFILEVKMQRNHMIKLIESFNQIKNELQNIEELSDDL